MRPYLSSLACSGLFILGSLAGFSAPAMADSTPGSVIDIAPTVDAAGEAFRTLRNTNCSIGCLQSGILIRPPVDTARLPDPDSNIQLARGGGGHGGGMGGGHGMGGVIIRGGGFHGGGWHGMGGGGWRGGNVWRGGGWHGMGGGGWRGWRGSGWHGMGGGGGWRGGDVWRGGGRHGMGGFHGNRRFNGNNFFIDGGGGDFGWWGFGLPLYPYFDDYYGDDYYGLYGPAYVAPHYYRAQLTRAHVAWCASRYRSYRVSDNTFQPNNGPRRQCVSPR